MSRRFYCHPSRCSWPDCEAKTACLATRREGHLVSIVVDADSLTEEDARVVARLGMLLFRPGEHIRHSDTCQNPTNLKT